MGVCLTYLIIVSCERSGCGCVIQEHFKCLYDQSCRMDLTNRRFCKHCRLRKCFEIGMKREYILTAEEKAQKRLKIEQNRLNVLMLLLLPPFCGHTGQPALAGTSS